MIKRSLTHLWDNEFYVQTINHFSVLGPKIHLSILSNDSIHNGLCKDLKFSFKTWTDINLILTDSMDHAIQESASDESSSEVIIIKSCLTDTARSVMEI